MGKKDRFLRAIAHHKEKVRAKINPDNITIEEGLRIIEDDVFSNIDFKRHIKETAIKMNVSEEAAAFVVKNALTFILLECIKIQVKPRRINFFLFMFEILEKKHVKKFVKKKKRYKKSIRKNLN